MAMSPKVTFDRPCHCSTARERHLCARWAMRVQRPEASAGRVRIQCCSAGYAATLMLDVEGSAGSRSQDEDSEVTA